MFENPYWDQLPPEDKAKSECIIREFENRWSIFLSSGGSPPDIRNHVPTADDGLLHKATTLELTVIDIERRSDNNLQVGAEHYASFYPWLGGQDLRVWHYFMKQSFETNVSQDEACPTGPEACAPASTLSSPVTGEGELSDKDVFDRIIRDFKNAWKRFRPDGGSAPAMEDHVLPGGLLRGATVFELTLMDVEFRLRHELHIDPGVYAMFYPRLDAPRLRRFIKDLKRSIAPQHVLTTSQVLQGGNQTGAGLAPSPRQSSTQVDDDLKDAGPHEGRDVREALVCGQKCGPYEIVEFVGSGGMGQVYKARHVVMAGRLDALKVIHRPDGAEGHFLQEIKAAGMIPSPHGNVVTFHHAFEDQGRLFLAMEYVEGINLQQKLNQDGPLPWRTACEFAKQAAAGLAYLHNHGIIHGDVKPANLILLAGNQVKVLDLGLALLRGEWIGGTPGYWAPERARKQNVDKRSDIYSLGCTLFCLLTGAPPNPECKSAKVIEERLAYKLNYRKAARGLAVMLARMLAEDPEDRQESMNDIRLELNDLDDEFPTLGAYYFRNNLTVRQFMKIWNFEKNSQYNAHTCWVLVEWWQAYPDGLIAMYDQERNLVGWLGIWPLTKESLDKLKQGLIKETEIAGSMMEQFREKDAECWYIGGIATKGAGVSLAADAKKNWAFFSLVRGGFRKWFKRCKIGYPMEVLALGDAAKVSELLGGKLLAFTCIRDNKDKKVPDGCPLYCKKVDSPEALKKLLRLAAEIS